MANQDPDHTGEDELAQRMAQLKSKLEQSGADREQEKEADRSNANKDRSGIGQALRLSSEFIAGVVVGAALGYGIDTYFGTSPWGMIVFLLLGFAAAVLNVMRAAGLVAESKMRLKPARDLQNQQQDEDSRSEDEDFGPENEK